MFHCEYCNKVSQSGEGCELVIAEKRVKTYEDKKTMRTSTGWEIAKVKKRCPSCKAQAEAEESIQTQSLTAEGRKEIVKQFDDRKTHVVAPRKHAYEKKV